MNEHECEIALKENLSNSNGDPFQSFPVGMIRR